MVKGKIASNKAVYMMKPIKQTNITYIKYYLDIKKPNLQESANYSTGLGNVDMNYFKNMPIRILKPHLITQYKLDDDFILMDKLRNDIQNTFKLQENTTKNMMTLVLNNTMDNKLINIHEKLNINYNQLMSDLDYINKIESNIKQITKKVVIEI